jgi:hypothetical protein
VFRGHYVTAFEVSIFRPCNSSEEWWLSGNLERLYQPGVLLESPATHSSECYVELRGRLAGPGSYGHLGRYQRELVVTEVLAARPASPGNCR